MLVENDLVWGMRIKLDVKSPDVYYLFLRQKWSRMV